MNFLITGSTGFIGKNLRIHLRNEGHEVCALYRDAFKNLEYVADKIAQADVIVHLAADPHVKDTNVESHFPLTYKLLETVKQYNKNCPKFVYMSSATIYGGTDVGFPDAETATISPRSVYALCKNHCEDLVKLYHRQNKIKGIVIRSVANVGRYSTHGILHDFIAKLKSDNPKFELIGKYPGSTKPFIHVNDTCCAIEFLAHQTFNSTSPMIFNVGPKDSRPVTVEEVSNIVMNEMDIRKPVEWTWDTWEGDDQYVEVDTTRLQDLGFTWKYPGSVDAIRGAVKDILRD